MATGSVSSLVVHVPLQSTAADTTGDMSSRSSVGERIDKLLYTKDATVAGRELANVSFGSVKVFSFRFIALSVSLAKDLISLTLRTKK